MSDEKNKVEKNDMADSSREKINKNLGIVVLIFMFLLVIFFITLQISINNLSTQTEKYVENINLNNEKIVSINEKIVSIEEDLSNEIKKYNQAKIGRDQ
ncbi:MAG: hypothetical protein MUP34_01790, partial [Candidatus Atribacteria bacterium]|nr:hypothetical protein [Candidatus Atribacteria bacterium]